MRCYACFQQNLIAKNTTMKAFQLALIVALIVPLGGNAVADPRPAKHSGTSSSYKSGFSSQKATRSNSGSQPKFGSFGSKQKQSTPAPAPSSDGSAAAQGKRGGFGSFGSGNGSNNTAQQQRQSGSAMSRDLDQSDAQARAQRTLEARRAGANTLPPLNDRVPGVDRARQQPYGPAPAPYGQQQPYNQPSPPVQQNRGNGSGGGLGAALMGFMLGHSMSAGAHPGAGYPGNGAGTNPATNTGNVAAQNSQVANGADAGLSQLAPAAQQQSSFGSTVLRTFVWLALLGAIGWGMYFGIRAMRRGKERRSANYSFERD
jgi:hypothetical protein